jgi:hypothetical protein
MKRKDRGEPVSIADGQMPIASTDCIGHMSFRPQAYEKAEARKIFPGLKIAIRHSKNANRPYWFST